MENFVCSAWSPAIAFILGLAVIIEMVREYKEEE